MYAPLKYLIVFVFFLPLTTLAQTVNFEDDFTDQDISDWTGTPGDFIFLNENENILLQQDAAGAGSSYLSIPSSNVTGYWEFFLRLNNFSPSDGNKAEIYLMSDASDLLADPVNGYMLQAGENQSNDVFRLFRITAGVKDGEVLTGTTDISAGGDFRVKVIRDASGNWTLEVANGYTGVLTQEATGTDNTYSAASHFGFVTTYTSTRADRFAFDFKIDIPPIEVSDIATVSDTDIDVTFNQSYDPASVQTSDFVLSPGSLNPQSFNQLSSDILRISFLNPIQSGVLDLNITGIDDLSGSTTLADTTIRFVIYDAFQAGDIIINEFMKDPPAGVSEYVEIKNISGKYLNLKDWQIGDNGSLTTIATTNTPILPNSFAVISDDTTLLNTYFGSANYIESALPALNNGDDQIRLFDSSGSLADSLSYTSEWGGIDVAIERRDATVPSIFRENWGDSPNINLGTPGAENEIPADTTPPQLTNVLIKGPQALLIAASERLESTAAEDPANYTLSLNPETGAVTPSIPAITAAVQVAADSVRLTLDTEISEYNGTWNVEASNLTDIFGNATNTSYEFPFLNPFTLTNLAALSNNQLLLQFSEDVDPVSIQPSDFNLNSNPLDGSTLISQPAANEIQLSLNTALSSGPGTISISSLQSINGWTINAGSTQVFFLYDNYAAGDIIINEFMKDPPSGAVDYVELKNTSGKYLNLKDWQIGDELSITSISPVNTVIFPDSFAVVTSDTAALKTIFGDADYIEAPLPNLNSTTSDQIRLFTDQDEQVDSLQYETNWGGENVALERRDPTVSSIFRENWGNSPSPIYGSPGIANLIETDQEPAQLMSLDRVSDYGIRLIYTERIQETQATNSINYTLTADNITDHGLSIQSIIYNEPDTVLIQFDADLPSTPNGTTYDLTIENQTDLFGNVSPALSESFFIIDFGKADSGEVFINEFMYDPADGFTDFIELYNPTDSAYNLQNWTFNDNSGIRKLVTSRPIPFLPESRIVLAPDSSISELFPGIPLIVMGTRFANLNSTTSDDIVIRNAGGDRIDSLTYDNSWGGNEISLERRSLSVSPNYKENWGASPSPQLATPGLENMVADDTTPPDLEELTIQNDSTIQLRFSERIQGDPAENLANYSVSGPAEIQGQIPPVDGITFSEPAFVTLQFQHPFPVQELGTTFELAIQNQVDIFGNTAGTISRAFFLIEIQDADSGDVVINEFMYDPVSTLTEFIELYNQSDKNIDLKNWTLNDNTGNRRIISYTNIELPQGGFMILAPDSTLFDLYSDKQILVLGTAFSSLNNGSDNIVIRDQNGSLIDSLTYTSDWGGDQVSLERLDAGAPSIYSENWTESPSAEFATPGSRNATTPDDSPPAIVRAYPAGSDTLRIEFNERVLEEPAALQANYSVFPSLGINEIIHKNGNEISLVLSAGLADGTVYTLTVQNQEDIFGNLSPSLTTEIEFTQFSTASPGDIIVNEILYRRESGDSAEFIELFNRSNHNFDLSNWRLSDNTNSTSLPAGTQIRSGHYLVLTDTETFAPNISTYTSSSMAGESIYLPGFPSLNDDEDAVVLKSEIGTVIDSVYYNEFWGGNKPGISLERKDPESASNDANNWASSTATAGNSAGNQSSVFEPDQIPPQLIFAKILRDNRILALFSEFIKPDNSKLTINGNPLSISEFDPGNGNIIITSAVSSTAENDLNLTISTVKDYRGNTSNDLSIEVSQPLTAGSVVINEILFDPLADPEDNLPDQTEYIELYNRSGYAISLEGLYLHDAPDENAEVRSISPVSTQYSWIPANGFALVYAEDQASDFNNSRLAEYFELSDSENEFSLRVDRSSLSLASTDDAVFLADSTGLTIDSVYYDESWHNPNLFDTDGVALERIDPDGPGNDESNWSSSTRVSGGTPAEQNSIHQVSGPTPENTGLTFSPNPFSPDDDGFEDNLFINYKLDEPDYLLRVRIYDRYGRLVRYLADGIQAGYEGSLLWDGLTDSRKKNRVGIYIVLFEAYNSSKGKSRTFKETVVLARKF